MSTTSTDGTGMVVCGRCGSANEGSVTFCGSCGAYLEWDGQRILPPEPVAVAKSGPEPVPKAERQSLIDRVKVGLGLDETTPSDTPQAAGTSPETPEPGVLAPGSAAASRPAPGVAQAGGMQPGAVQPGAEAQGTRKRVAPSDDRRPQPGETVCRECGAGNAPNRKFCRQCGTDLADAVLVPVPPWWRRIIGRRPKEAAVAGTRPVVRRRYPGFGRLLRATVLVVALVLAVRLAWPWVGVPVETVRDRIAGAQVVNPVRIIASSAAPAHPAALARDGATNTFWSPARPGAGAAEFVEATFAKSFRLVAIQVFNGSSEQPKPYLQTGRVATVLLTATKEDGKVETTTLPLQDVPGRQDFSIGVSDVARVRLTVQTAFGATPRTRIALAEVAFFKRS